ncbi:MAG: M20/M25/M40 family metallo-hydrolase [Burkholderiales bacterium]|nr:M20/M25/M40 family metallo-hydrolase [Burkholderiales bacterium]MBZ0248905.1 M20/M25/M40 family metallo-hydrolase [Burkholderiales bacterium]
MRRALAAALLALPACAVATEAAPHDRFTRDIYRELVEIRTVHPDGDNTAAARAMARRLLEAGFDAKDVEVVEPAPRKGNLVARLRGTGELRPLLLLAHIDVVEAKAEDWSVGLDPFRLTEKDGYYYGRGTLDDKAMAAIFVANLARLRAEGFRPKRDIVVALTADEEGGTHNGVAWLLRHRRELVDAEFALNEGGAGTLRDGKPWIHGVQVGEKMYLSFDLEATHPGGHSSVPTRDNAIYDLAAALSGVARLELPARVGYVTRAHFMRLANIESGELADAIAAVAAGRADDAQLRRVSSEPRYNAQLRTTCVATKLEGGHAENALPQRAKAVVNCRLLPGEDPDFVLRELQRAAGERVRVKARGAPRASEATDAQSPVMRTIERVSESMWPGVPVVPLMSAGATDGSRLRNAGIPTYGVSGLFLEHGEVRIHGRDERLAVKSFVEGTEFLHRLVKALAAGE